MRANSSLRWGGNIAKLDVSAVQFSVYWNLEWHVPVCVLVGAESRGGDVHDEEAKPWYEKELVQHDCSTAGKQSQAPRGGSEWTREKWRGSHTGQGWLIRWTFFPIYFSHWLLPFPKCFPLNLWANEKGKDDCAATKDWLDEVEKMKLLKKYPTKRTLHSVFNLTKTVW